MPKQKEQESGLMKNFAITLAKKAGAYLLKNFRQHPELLKNRGLAKEVHTQYDLGSDRIIREAIERKFPQHSLLTEEHGWTGKKEWIQKNNYLWVVDSLDGTTNYSVGNPFFSVSIAVMKGKELILGVVYAPFLQELFVAERNKGAFLNGKKIRVSSVTQLSQSYFVSCEGGEQSNERIAKINTLFHPRIKDVRKLGSAALEGCWVACGRAEAYLVTQIHPWDVAAAVLIVQEAGGSVTDFSGEEWELKTSGGGNPEKSDMGFSNGKMHKEILNEVKYL